MIMDLLKKVRNSFSKTVYFDSSGDHGVVYTMDIHGFGDKDDPDNYHGVETAEGEEMFRTLLKRLYHEVLYKDPNWHYFMEGTYNHLRFSRKFWIEVEELLELHEANYDGWKQWVDEQGITKKYQHIFQPLFHHFSLLAVQGYDEDEIDLLLDRVIHCFMNHQQLYLPKHRKQHGAMTEPLLVAKNAVKRAEYIGHCSGVNSVKEGYEKWADEASAWYYSKCEEKKDAIDDFRESTEGLMEMLAEMEPEQAKEILKEHREKLDEIKAEEEI